MYCQKCGKLISDNEYYCPNCGKQIKFDLPTSPYKTVTFSKAITSFFTNCFTIEGVASPKEYWTICVLHIAITAVLSILGLTTSNLIFSIIIFIPFLTLTARRFHDLDKSGAYCILYGYSLLAFMSRAFFESRIIVFTLFITSIISLLIQFIILSKPTNPKSRWNPVNGYQ